MNTPSFGTEDGTNPFESFINKLKSGFCDITNHSHPNDNDDEDDDNNGFVNREIFIAEPPVGNVLLLVNNESEVTTITTNDEDKESEFEVMDAPVMVHQQEGLTATRRRQRVHRIIETKIYSILLVILTCLALYQLGYRLEFKLDKNPSTTIMFHLNHPHRQVVPVVLPPSEESKLSKVQNSKMKTESNESMDPNDDHTGNPVTTTFALPPKLTNPENGLLMEPEPENEL